MIILVFIVVYYQNFFSPLALLEENIGSISHLILIRIVIFIITNQKIYDKGFSGIFFFLGKNLLINL